MHKQGLHVNSNCGELIMFHKSCVGWNRGDRSQERRNMSFQDRLSNNGTKMAVGMCPVYTIPSLTSVMRITLRACTLLQEGLDPCSCHFDFQAVTAGMSPAKALSVVSRRDHLGTLSPPS